MKKLNKALQIYPDAVPKDPAWTDVCWDEALAGQAKPVLKTCDIVVAQVMKEGNQWMARNSRGDARVLAGNTEGAIEDFEYFI